MSKQKIDDGGQAFPSEQGQVANGEWNDSYDPGITLRQYYAAEAMKGMISALKSGGTIGNDRIVPAAFKMADDMIAFERRKNL